MKKIFTLIAAAMAVLSVNAQQWNASNADDIAKGSKLLDNEYVTITTGVQDSKATAILDVDGKAITKKVGDYSFTKQTSIRVTDTPAEANNWEGTAYSDCTPVGVSLIVAPKADVDITLYYGHGDGKAVSCYDVTGREAVAITETAAGDGYTGVFKFQNGHNYVIYATGGTTSLWGIDTAAGTYVAPSNKIYASESSASNADGFDQISYGDGSKLILLKSGKSFSSASSISVGEQKYTSIKISNGAQCKFVAPEGKYVTKVTFYSYINVDAENRTAYWAEVNGTTYTADDAKVMHSCKDGANPDVNEYELGGVAEFTFKNAGEQPCVVLDVVYGEPSAIQNVSVASAKKTAKSLRNGQVVIETANGTFTAAGARVE